jgi:hypothetical protein
MAFDGELECRFLGNLSVFQVGFVSDNNNDRIVAFVIVEHFYPRFYTIEGVLNGDVIYNYCTVRIPQICWNKASKFLLTRGVPEQQSVHMIIVLHIFR